MFVVSSIQGPNYATIIDDFISSGCSMSIGAVYGDEVGTYLKVSKRLVDALVKVVR